MMMYDLHVDGPTLAAIRMQSAKLAALAKDISAWNKGPYAKYFRLINSETAESLSRLWKLYSGDDYLIPAFLATYNNAIKERFREIEILEELDDPLTQTHLQFWSLGDRGNFALDSTKCNPLFAYTSLAGSRFAVDKDSNPQAGFHLIVAVAKITRQYALHPKNRPHAANDIGVLAINAFRQQFEASCDSFKRLVSSDSQRFRMRVFTGDAIAFCMGLRQLREPGYIANCYSRPGSLRPLIFDGENHPSKSLDRTPTKFNVVETGYLMDQIGLLNLLPNVINSMKSPASVLYTSTQVEKVADETNLLEKLLCGNVSVMCALLGVVPSAYLCGHTFQAFEEYHDLRPLPDRPLTNRIVWVPTTSTDPKVDLPRADIRFDRDKLVEFWVTVYNNMCPYDTSSNISANRSCRYTRRSFAGLLAFLKTRIHENWGLYCVNLITALSDQRDEADTHELGCQLYLFNLAPFAPINGITLKPFNLQDPLIFVLTVPRQTLQRIFSRLYRHSLPIRFQIYIKKPKEPQFTITAVQHCYGRMESAGVEDATIIEDLEGWQGTSDLHIWGYVHPHLLEHGILNDHVGVALTPQKEVAELFRSDLDDTLSILDVCIKQDPNAVKILRKSPNLNKPSRSDFSLLAYEENHVAKTTESFIVAFPLLDLDNQHFMTRIDVTGDALKRLQNKDSISVDQITTCSLTIRFGAFQVQCSYLFPVDCATTKLRVSRLQGWIEVSAPLLTPSRRGRFASTPFPVVFSRARLQVTNCYSSYVVFRQLPPIDHRLAQLDVDTIPTEAPSIPNHLYTMFNERQKDDPNSDPKMTLIMMHFNSLLFPFSKPSSVSLWLEGPNGKFGLQLVFFIMGLYLDFNSRSVTGQAYVLFMTNDKREIDTDITLRTNPEVHQWWKGALPSMVESARTWNHAEKCEYKTEGIPRMGSYSICSCGQGKVGQDFKDVVEWSRFSADVTRIAIQPIFPVPWLDTVRRPILADGEKKTKTRAIATATTPAATTTTKTKGCNVCLKEDPGKKCGKCMLVAYCSRECQSKDWREHKKVCGLKK